MHRTLVAAALVATVAFTGCGGEEASRSSALATPGADRVLALLKSPPAVSDGLRLTLALELKRSVDAEHGQGAFRKALYAAALDLSDDERQTAEALRARQTAAFRAIVGDANPADDPAFEAFVRSTGGIPHRVSDRARLSQDEAQAAGTLRRIAMLGAQQLASWKAEAASLRTKGDDDAAQAIQANIAKLTEQLARLATSLEGQVETLRSGLGELTRAVADAGSAAPGDSMQLLAARTQLLDETLYGNDSVADRIEALKSNPKGAYKYMPKSGHSELVVSLERVEEHRKSFRELDKVDATTGKPGKYKREKVYLEAHQSVDAASDVVTLLGATGVIDPATQETLNTGLEAATNVIGLGASVLTGDITGVISHGARLLTMMIGIEPPPDPAEVRHEQVMDALMELAKGQQQIMDMVVALSEQSQAQHRQVMEKFKLLDDIHAIVSSTHRMVAEDQLEGLRDFRQFIDQQKFHAVEVTNPVTGKTARDPELGFESYAAMRRHFERNAKRYARAVRFLNDVTRGDELNILRVVQNEQALAALAQDLGLTVDRVRQPLTDAIARRNASLGFALGFVNRQARAALFGAMTEPAKDFDELVERFESLMDPDVAASYRARSEALGLSDVMKRFYNPLLVDEIVNGHLHLRPYELLVSKDGATLRKADALDAKTDLLRNLGEDADTRLANFLEPLRRAERLLQQGLAQNALISGDMMIPIFATLGLSRVWGPSRVGRKVLYGGHAQTAAYRALLKNPMLRDNAIRFQIYAGSKLNRKRLDAIQKGAVAMLIEGNPEYAVRPSPRTKELAFVSDAARKRAVNMYAHALGEVDALPKLDQSDEASSIESALAGFDLRFSYRAPDPRHNRGPIRDPRRGSTWTIEFHDPGNKAKYYRPLRVDIPLRHEIEAGLIKRTTYGERLAKRQVELTQHLMSYTVAFGEGANQAAAQRRLLTRAMVWAAGIE